uniref:Uncharacterized protein n=1 Tax=Avena sativa TaxID=4498 RepID=A0ACD6A4T4_AVESA
MSIVVAACPSSGQTANTDQNTAKFQHRPRSISICLLAQGSLSPLSIAMRSPVAHAAAGAGAGATVAALLGHPLAVLSERPAPRLTRLLLNVTVERSLWPVHVVLAADATVADLARAAVAAYVAEGRRPPLPASGANDDAAARFELHLSKYSLDALDPDEKVLDLGCRNFFLCARRS